VLRCRTSFSGPGSARQASIEPWGAESLSMESNSMAILLLRWKPLISGGWERIPSRRTTIPEEVEVTTNEARQATTRPRTMIWGAAGIAFSLRDGGLRPSHGVDQSSSAIPDMKKPRRREIIRGFITFFWNRGSERLRGKAPRVRLENVVRGDPVPLRRSELQILWHAGHSRKEAPVLPRRGS
jgi:hypothetical protein